MHFETFFTIIETRSKYCTEQWQGPKKGPTGEASQAGLPNAHGVLPQMQIFFLTL